jgi:hypothetical protein
MKRKNFLSLTLAVFMLLSVFMPMSFADDSPITSDENLYTDITANMWFDSGSTKSGKSITAYLGLSWNVYSETVNSVPLTVTLKAAKGLNIGSPLGGASGVTFTESDLQTLKIETSSLVTQKGASLSIPFSVIFPNGVTPDGLSSAAYIAEIKSGAYSYSPNFDENSLKGNSSWTYGATSGMEFYSTISAIAATDRRYNNSKIHPGRQTLDIPASAGKDKGVYPAAALTGDDRFAFTLGAADFYGNNFGRMNISDARPAAVIETSGDIELDINYFEKSVTTDIVKALPDGKFLWSWDEKNDSPGYADDLTSVAMHTLYINKIKYTEDMFKDAKITMTPVRYDASGSADFVLNSDGVYMNAAYGYVKALGIADKTYPINAGAVQEAAVSKIQHVDPDKPHQYDGEVDVAKTSLPWKYDLGNINNMGASGDYSRNFITNDILFKSPDGLIDHGDRVWFKLGFVNNTSRDILPEVVLTEEAGKSFRTELMHMIGVDPGAYTAGLKIQYKINASDGWTVFNGAGPSLLNGGNPVAKIMFTYTNIPKTANAAIEANPPRVLFEADQNPDLKLARNVNNKHCFDNEVNVTVTPFKDAAADEIISKTAKSFVEYKAAGTSTSSSKTAVKAVILPTGSNNLNNGAILPGSTVTYKIAVTNTAASANENIGRVLIKDLLDNAMFDLSTLPATATVTVKSSKPANETVIPAGKTADDAAGTGMDKDPYTYTGVALNNIVAASDLVNNGLKEGETGFYLWLKTENNGRFWPGDAITLTFDVKVKNTASGDIKNAYNYMLVPKYISENEEPKGPSGGVDSGHQGEGNWSGSGNNILGIRSKEVYATLKKEVVDSSDMPIDSPSYYVDDNNPSESNDEKSLLYKYDSDNNPIRYSITAALSASSDLGGFAPVIVDRLPLGFTLAADPENDARTNLAVHYERDGIANPITNDKFTALRAEETAAGVTAHFLVVKVAKSAFDGGEMKPGDSLIVRFNASPPSQITFDKKLDDVSVKYDNRAYFDPNGQLTSAGDPRQIAGLMKSNSNNKIMYSAGVDLLPPDAVIKNITGMSGTDSFDGIGEKEEKIFLYASKDVTFLKSHPIVSLKKFAVKDNKTINSTDNSLFAGNTVHYKAIFANTDNTGASGGVTVKTIVDLLPPGQGYTHNSLNITKSDNTPVTGVSVKTSDTDNGSRMLFDIGAGGIVLAKGEYITITYDADVVDNENELRKLVEVPKQEYANGIAVYLSDTYYYGSKGTAIKPFADEGPYKIDDTSIKRYVFNTANVYYNVKRIHPDIKKEAYYENEHLNTEQAINLISETRTDIKWKLTFKNGTSPSGSDKYDATMSGYKIYDVLPQGTVMTKDQENALKSAYGSKFSVEYLQNERLIVFTALESAKMSPGKNDTIEYETAVSFGAAITGKVTNTAYLVPNDNQYFERSDVGSDGAYVTPQSESEYYDAFLSDKAPAVRSKQTVKFSTPINAVSWKFIQNKEGAIATSEHVAPIGVNRKEEFTYGFVLENNSNVKAFEKYAVIDVLPRVNDRYITSNAGSRGSMWSPYPADDPQFKLEIKAHGFTGNFTETENYTLYVNTRSDFNQALDSDWNDADPNSDWILVRSPGGVLNKEWKALDKKRITAIRLVGENGLGVGESFRFTWNMEVPDNIEEAPMDGIAWNSAAYGVWINTSGGLLRFNAEPDKVGARIAGGCGDLKVTKSLTNPNYFEGGTFTFSLYNANDPSKMPSVTKTGEHSYAYDADGENKEFSITVPEYGESGFVTVTGLPEGRYIIKEIGLDDRKYKTDAEYTYDGPGIYGNTDANKHMTDVYVYPKGTSEGSPPASVSVQNTAVLPYSLIVEKHIVNQAYSANRNFEFRLDTRIKSGDEWHPVRLEKQNDNTFKFIEGGGNGDGKFTIDVPVGRPMNSVVIKDLPKRYYRVVELTKGYAETYAYYSYNETSDAAVSSAENTGLFISGSFAVHKASVTNYVSVPSGGGGGDPTPPTPGKPITPPVITPDDGGGNTNPPDGGGITPPSAPGGNDPSVPPRPTVPGHNLTPAGNGVYIEIGDDGTPLGEWYWDEPTEQWIFDEYPPLANLPQTGFIGELEETGRTVYPFICLITLLLLLAAAMPPIADMRRNSRDAQK